MSDICRPLVRLGKKDHTGKQLLLVFQLVVHYINCIIHYHARSGLDE